MNNKLEILENENKNLKEQINKFNEDKVNKNNEIIKNKDKEIEDLKKIIEKNKDEKDIIENEKNIIKVENDLIKNDIITIGNSFFNGLNTNIKGNEEVKSNYNNLEEVNKKI